LSLESGAMNQRLMLQAKPDTTSTAITRPVLQRKCACDEHHYAPLAIIGVGAGGPEVKSDLRLVIEPIVKAVT
jgi:hypothetical protein